MKWKKKISVIGITIMMATSCGEEEVYSPKKYGHLRVDLTTETKSYNFHKNICLMSFELPDYARVMPKKAPDDISCYADIKIPEHKATINLTYKRLFGPGNKDSLAVYLNQSHQLAQKHLIKADDFTDTLILDTSKRVFAHIFNLTGDVASPVQFVVTDSTDNFLRGSLDFFAKPNYDSIRPVLEYVTDDIYHFISTLEWSN